MTQAFKEKYGGMRDRFAAITRQNLVPNRGKTLKKPCDTPVSGSRVCGHAQHEHNGSGEFRCKATGCPCLRYTYLGEE